jgi:cobaltochelatase CobS
MNTVTCQICGAEVTFIELHLTENHPDCDINTYTHKYPDAPLLSELAQDMLEKKAEEWGSNGKKTYSIKTLFNIKPFKSTVNAWGWEKPTEFVPAQIHYFFRRDLLASVLYAFENFNEPILLIGPTGSGKTSVFEQVAARLNRPVTRTNLDGDVTRSDIVGQWVLGGENTMTFHYGPLAVAMKEGRIYIIDEIDAGASPVTMVLQAVLEGKPLTLLETGEVIHPHPDFRIMATANTNGMGDETGLYAGTQPQNYALFDRFKMVELVDYASAEEEKTIVESQTGVTDESGILTKLIKVANNIREAHKGGEIQCTMSTRNVCNIAHKLQVFGDIKRAYKSAYLNKLTSGDLDTCNSLFQKTWG